MIFSLKKIICFLLILCSIILPTYSFSDKKSDADQRKDQIKRIESHLEREKEKFQTVKIKEKGLLNQLADFEKTITQKRQALKEIEDSLEKNKNELKIHQGKLSQLQKSLARMESLLSKRLVAFYKYAKRGYMRILSTTDDLDQLNHNMKYLRVIMNDDRKVINQTIEDQAEYRKEVSLIKDKIGAIKSLDKDEKEKLSALKQELENKVLFLSEIHKEKEVYEIAVKELQSAAENLRSTILNLEQQPKVSKIPLPKDFSEAKGRLPMPLKGKIYRRAREKGEKTFKTLKGIYIGAEFGSKVRAVFPGRVDFSGELKGYGQVIIINHGERFFTISAYLLKREKFKGQSVSAGDVIGLVGESELVTGPALYFEIRKGEKNLNPLKWLKVN